MIEKYYQTFNQKNVNALIDLLDENVVHCRNQGQRVIGKEQFKRFLNEIYVYYDEFIDNIVIMSNIDGTRVSAEYQGHGKYIATDSNLPPAKGQKYSVPGGAFFEIKNNKILRVTNYFNIPEWLEQIK